MADFKPIFITDASILVKWAINEAPNLKEALLLREDFLNEKIEIIIPTHCFYEICNVLGRKYRNTALSFCTFLMASEIEEHALTFDTAALAFGIMRKHKDISFYDASYHALAMQKKGIFITADEKYFKRTKKEGRVMLLKNYDKKR